MDHGPWTTDHGLFFQTCPTIRAPPFHNSTAWRSSGCWRVRRSCRCGAAIRRSSSRNSNCSSWGKEVGLRRRRCARRSPRSGRDRFCRERRRRRGEPVRSGPGAGCANDRRQADRDAGHGRCVDAAERAPDRQAAPLGSHRVGAAPDFIVGIKRALGGRARLHAVASV